MFTVLVHYDEQKQELLQGMGILSTDKQFRHIMSHRVSDGVAALQFLSYPTLDVSGKSYDPLDEDLMDASNVSCNFHNIETSWNLDSKTFTESVKNDYYKQNDCWINSITCFYGDTDEHRLEIKCFDKKYVICNSWGFWGHGQVTDFCQRCFVHSSSITNLHWECLMCLERCFADMTLKQNTTITKPCVEWS